MGGGCPGTQRSPCSSVSPCMSRAFCVFLCLLYSTMISLVLLVFSKRRFSSQHLTRSCISLQCLIIGPYNTLPLTFTTPCKMTNNLFFLSQNQPQTLGSPLEWVFGLWSCLTALLHHQPPYPLSQRLNCTKRLQSDLIILPVTQQQIF